MRKYSFSLAVAICLALVVGFISCKGGEEHAAEVKAAQAAADSWLKLVDDSKYAQSWDDSAELLQAAITKEDWVKTMNAARKPFGALASRKVKSSKYATSLPGAPDGQYVVFEFDTSFENKKNSIETITPMMSKDGKWQVAGYYIK